jgi:hypothetical protein
MSNQLHRGGAASWITRVTVGCAVLAASIAACSDGPGPAEPPPTPDPTLVQVGASGRIHSLDGTVPAGLRVIIASGTSRTSAPVSAAGTFSITADVKPGSYDVIIDVEGAPRTTHPALLRMQTGAPGTPINLVLVPMEWTVTKGSYSDRTVDISVDAAFRPPCTTEGDTNCDGFYPQVWTTGVKMWPASSLPIPVAFDRERSSDPMSAADSVAFWNIIDRMNQDYGTQLFRPARIDQVSFLGGAQQQPDRAIVIRTDGTLTGFGAWTNWWWDGGGNLYSGVVRVRSTAGLSNTALMTHELLHTLSIKHSCSWVTTMGGYGCSSNAGLSAHDVAYAHLAERIGTVQRATGAVQSLAAARNGQRVVLLGMQPVAINTGLAALRTDGTDHAH